MPSPGELLGQIPEFSATQSIKIAPNTSVPVTDRILAIIDSSSFQRLRAVRQLSLADRVFPSATHTRFSHALGVYHNVLDYLRHLDRFAEFRNRYSVDDYLSVLLAGLLHDLGHYPCSHQLDHLTGFPRHEELTIAMIEGTLRFEAEDLSEIIQRNFALDPRLVTRFFKHQPEPNNLLLHQLIDSPIDADKCDYLPRDSYFCGVDYGTGFDRQRFIANLVPNKSGTCLSIREKGLLSAERFQLARYWMYRSVYWGHTVRALITNLIQACSHLNTEPDPAQLLAFNDNSFLDWVQQNSDATGQALVQCIHGRRKPFKRVYTIAYNHGPEIYQTLQSASARAHITQQIAKRAASLNVLTADHFLAWDVPPAYKSESWESFPVTMNNGREFPIEDESPVIRALGPAFLQGVRKIRLFAHPDYYSQAQLSQLPTIEQLLN